MMFQDRFPTASGSKDKKEKKVVPWQNQSKQNYNYDKTKTPPRSIKLAVLPMRNTVIGMVNKNNPPII